MNIEDVDTAVKIRNRVREIDNYLAHLSNAQVLVTRLIKHNNYLAGEDRHEKDSTVFEVTTSLIAIAIKKERAALLEDLSKI